MSRRPPRQERIPSDAELMFISTASTGTIHIAVRYSSHHMGEVQETFSNGAAFLKLATHPTVTRCGKRTFPQFSRDHWKTDRFSDDQLCRACYRTLHPDDQERAFEHDQPDGDCEDECDRAA